MVSGSYRTNPTDGRSVPTAGQPGCPPQTPTGAAISDGHHDHAGWAEDLLATADPPSQRGAGCATLARVGLRRGDTEPGNDLRWVADDASNAGPTMVDRGARSWLAPVAALAVIALGALTFVALSEESPAPAGAPTTTVPSSTLPVRQPPPPLEDIGDPTFDGPIMGSPTNMFVAIGSRTETVQVVDLDSGDFENLAIKGQPWLAVDGQLIVKQRLGEWFRVDMASPERTAEQITGRHDFFDSVVADQTATATDPTRLWFSKFGPDGGMTWALIEIETGEVLRRLRTPDDALIPEGSDGRPLSGPEVVGSRSGGIFELQSDDSYRQVVAEGGLVAVGRTRILITVCDATLSCENRWLDRESFAVTDATPLSGDFGVGHFFGDDTVLIAETFDGINTTINPPGPIIKVIDLASGAPLRTGLTRQIEDVWLSPDGRYLARNGMNAVLISNLQVTDSAALSGLLVDEGQSLIWGVKTS